MISSHADEMTMLIIFSFYKKKKNKKKFLAFAEWHISSNECVFCLEIDELDKICDEPSRIIEVQINTAQGNGNIRFFRREIFEKFESNRTTEQQNYVSKILIKMLN